MKQKVRWLDGWMVGWSEPASGNPRACASLRAQALGDSLKATQLRCNSFYLWDMG